MRNRAAKLKRGLDLDLGSDIFIRKDPPPSYKTAGVIIHFDEGTACRIEEHFDEGKPYSRVEISFPQPFGHILLYKIPASWIEEI
jgi:hypothetical protein